MYSLFLRNVKGFDAQVEPGSYTEKCFQPIKLLGNKIDFLYHKKRNTDVYKNAKILINEAKKLKSTKKYHRFDVLLRELEGEGIIFDDFPVNIELDEYQLSEQISLLWQCLFFNYVLV